MKKRQEFAFDDRVMLIDAHAAQAMTEANPDIAWPVPVISQYGERVHCWNSERREFTITLSATEIRRVNP
jgi:hypothetical protein